MSLRCAECSAALPAPTRGRPRRYCSRRCQARAYRRRRDLGRTATPYPARTGREQGTTVTRDELVHLGIELADSDGIDAVSVHAVARRAGLSRDQFYRWMRSRDHLLAAMVERVLTENQARRATQPAPPDPRDHLERLARDEWTLYRRHPWLLPVLATTRPPTCPAVLALVDNTVAVLIRAGYEPADAFAGYLAVSGYVQGLALLHVAERAEQHTGAPRWDTWRSAARTRLEGTRHAHSSAWLLAADPPYDDADAAVDRWFEFGLARLLDGLIPPPGPQGDHERPGDGTRWCGHGHGHVGSD